MNRVNINKLIYFIIVIIFCGIFYSDTVAQEINESFLRVQRFTEDEGMDIQNPFGVLEFLNWNHPWNNYKYSSQGELQKVVALMKEAGVGFVRMDFLWDEIEPRPGEFRFGKYDYIVNLLILNDIKVLGLLDYTAGWASSCNSWNCPPTDNKLFVNFALKVIKHYRDRIKYWEVWNEPDSGTYWFPQDGLKSYSALLKDVYTAAKKLDPECKILNGGFANGLASVNRLYDNGAKDYFDILNIHVFASPLYHDSIKTVTAYPKLAHKIMTRNGDGHKKIWITEIGCPGVKMGLRINNWWMGRNPNERQQAGWVRSVYTQLTKDSNVEKIFWTFFRDCKEHWMSGIDYFGLVRWDFSRKPSFFAYKECVNNWKKNK